MKLRMGFVSNSSAASFCLYGWQTAKLSEEQITALREARQKDSWRSGSCLHTVWHPIDREIIGIGNSYSEIDHDEENWQSFESPPPDKATQQQLEKLAEELQLPRPEMYADTYWD